jgi:hypothetical protein
MKQPTLKTVRTELYNRASEILSIVDVWNLDAALNAHTLRNINHATSREKLGETLKPLLTIQTLIRTKLSATTEVCKTLRAVSYLIEDVDYASRSDAR